jgi:hypothetical protein
MTDKDRSRPSAAEQLARSLDRWTNEGGAAGTEAGALSPGEMHILRCLGAAVIAQWTDLPMPIQKLLFEHAVAAGDAGDTARLKEQIARFLHNHKDGAQQTD